MRAFILAGGFATRLWPLTERRAKPLLPIAGKPILTHLIEKLPKEMPVTVSTNAAFEEGFREWKASLGDREIELVIEGTTKDDHKLGALGAVSAWIQEEKIDDDLLVLTGDNYLGFSMEDFLQAFKGHPLLAAHDLGDLTRASAFGTVIVGPNSPPPPEEGLGVEVATGMTKIVTAFEEKPKEPRSTLVSSGCIILPKSSLPIAIEHAKQHPDNIGGIFEELLRRNIRVECFSFTDPWMDIGSFGSYLDAHRLLVGNHLLQDQSAIVEQTETEGAVTVGKGSRIQNSTLKDCMIFDDCIIENCTIRDCVIDSNCSLKNIDLQRQMLRAGTKLEIAG